MSEVKIQSVGSGLGVELPAEMIKRLKLNQGDSLCLEMMHHGGYRLFLQRDQFDEQLTLIEDYMHEEDA